MNRIKNFLLYAIDVLIILAFIAFALESLTSIRKMPNLKHMNAEKAISVLEDKRLTNADGDNKTANVHVINTSSDDSDEIKDYDKYVVTAQSPKAHGRFVVRPGIIAKYVFGKTEVLLQEDIVLTVERSS